MPRRRRRFDPREKEATNPAANPPAGSPPANSPKPAGAPNQRRRRRFAPRESAPPSPRELRSNFPTQSRPIYTNQGIKARSQRSSSWWAQRWITAMEALVDPRRLSRGRSYARAGQVLSFKETREGIEAKVQGSRPAPYVVSIHLKPLTDAQWEQVIDVLSEQAIFTAQLLAGEMPEDIEEAFHTAGVSMFPSEAGDLATECTCPDWANPCKHVAATHYILGDRFDDDPFLIFRMRGRTQEQILQGLRQRRAGESEAPAEEPAPEPEPAAPSLEESMDCFWQASEDLDSFPLTITPPTLPMPLIKRLGQPSFLDDGSLETYLKPVYDQMTRSALMAAYRDEESYEEENGNGNHSNGSS